MAKKGPFCHIWPYGRGEWEFLSPIIPRNTGIPFLFPKMGIIFNGPRYTWGTIYGSECLYQTNKLHVFAILAILAKLAILTILANLRFINTSASQSSGG